MTIQLTEAMKKCVCGFDIKNDKPNLSFKVKQAVLETWNMVTKIICYSGKKEKCIYLKKENNKPYCNYNK